MRSFSDTALSGGGGGTGGVAPRPDAASGTAPGPSGRPPNPRPLWAGSRSALRSDRRPNRLSGGGVTEGSGGTLPAASVVAGGGTAGAESGEAEAFGCAAGDGGAAGAGTGAPAGAGTGANGGTGGKGCDRAPPGAFERRSPSPRRPRSLLPGPAGLPGPPDPPRPSVGTPGGAGPRPPPGGRHPRTSMLLRIMATSPSACATESWAGTAAVVATGTGGAATGFGRAFGLTGGTAAVGCATVAVPPSVSRWTSIKCSTRSLICVVTSCMRCVRSPASDWASCPAASRKAAALLA